MNIGERLSQAAQEQVREATDPTSFEVRPEHLKEWIDGSGVAEDITRRSVGSVEDQKAIANLLLFKGYRGGPGWFCRGVRLDGSPDPLAVQFKPDEPLIGKGGKENKYLSPKASPRALLLPMEDKEYWQKVADSDQDVRLTEGAKKAGAGLTEGIATIGLTGVWNGQTGQKDGKPEIIESLTPFLQRPRRIILAWDSDFATKESVWKGLNMMARLLLDAHKKGCARVSVWVQWWDEKDKGLDDAIVAGSPRYLENFFEWKERTKDERSQTAEGLPKNQSEMADYLTGIIGNELRYVPAESSWYRHEGIWRPTDPYVVQRDIDRQCSEKAQEGEELQGYSINYVQGVQELLQGRLAWSGEWNDARLLSLTDGVLDTETRELLDHDPAHNLRISLGYSWGDRDLGCRPIVEWMTEILEDDQQLEYVRAFMLAMVLGITSCQKFLEIIGPRNSGKSSLQKLFTALVGLENTAAIDLEHLGGRFGLEPLEGKRHYALADEKKFGGSAAIIRRLVGEDTLIVDRKGKKAGTFIPEGLMTIVNNRAITFSESDSALDRRRRIIEVPKEYEGTQDTLIHFWRGRPVGKFAQYLPGLLEWVLDMGKEKALEVLKPNTPSDRLKANLDSARSETNAVVEWFEDRCIINADAFTVWGDYDPLMAIHGAREYPGYLAEGQPEGASYDNGLFASFCQWSQANGLKARSKRQFVFDIQDYLEQILKDKRVKLRRTNTARGVQGLALKPRGS